MSTKLYQIEAIRQLESLTFSGRFDTEFGLMSKAGRAAFDVLIKHWPNAKSLLIVAGSGNNAGDGFILGRHAQLAGLNVTITTLSPTSSYKGPAREAVDACLASDITIQEYDGRLDSDADVIVDALLGIGIHGEVSDLYKTVIEQVKALQKPVFAIDVPSGLDADTGRAMGLAVEADLTVTFLALKQGLFTDTGPAHCGTVMLETLELPPSLFENVTPSAELMKWETLRLQLPKRHRDAHKGCYGHVLIIGGDYGMGGAVRMAAEGACRVGSGLVSVATRPEHVSVINSNRPEIMCHQVASADELEPLLEKATVVVIGPGLGKTEWAEALLECVLRYEHPKLLDADALNLLAQKPKHSDRWILTPHPGEASRLLDTTAKAIQDNRFAAAMALQEKYGGTIVLKGSGTIVRSEKMFPSVCPAGNPGMASGGMGDVLSGVIGGFIAQKLSLNDAAELGVMVHAMAADMAAQKEGERGLLATDLMQYIRHLVNPDEFPL